MSETYSIHCHTCCVSLWIGQAPYREPFRFYLYGGNAASGRKDDPFSPLAEFLIMHQNHPLKFCSTNEEVEPEEDYLPLKDTPGLPIDEEELFYDNTRPSELDPYAGREPDEIEQMRQAYAANRITPSA